MPLLDIADLAPLKQQNKRLLGIDPGTKTLGLAVCDGLWMTANPESVIKRAKKWQTDLIALEKIIHERQIGGIVIGLPRNMDGSEGPRCQSVRAFANNLMKGVDLPIAFWDERLSTQAVTRTLIEADLSRKRRAEVVDKQAAAWILQGALDHFSHI